MSGHHNSSCDNESVEDQSSSSSKSRINLPEKQKNTRKTDSLPPKTVNLKPARNVFSPKQRAILEAEFRNRQYVDIPGRKQELSNHVELTKEQITIWFKNRRAKERKTSELLRNDGMINFWNPSSPLPLPSRLPLPSLLPYQQPSVHGMTPSYMADDYSRYSPNGPLPCHQNFSVTPPLDFGYDPYYYSQHQTPPSIHHLSTYLRPLYHVRSSTDTSSTSSIISSTTPLCNTFNPIQAELSSYPHYYSRVNNFHQSINRTIMPSATSVSSQAPPSIHHLSTYLRPLYHVRSSTDISSTSSIISSTTPLCNTFNPIQAELSSYPDYYSRINNYHQSINRTIMPSATSVLSQAPPTRPNHTVTSSHANNSGQFIPADVSPNSTKLFRPYDQDS